MRKLIKKAPAAKKPAPKVLKPAKAGKVTRSKSVAAVKKVATAKKAVAPKTGRTTLSDLIKGKPAAKAKKPRAKRAPYINPDTPLDAKQEMFCQEYLIDLNGTQAAIRAGYAKNSAAVTASRLLIKANTQKRIQELFNARAKRVQVDQDYVLSVIVDTVERCRQNVKPKLYGRDQEHEITETPDGAGLAYVFDAANVLKGTDQLGRHLKMFTDKIDLGGQNDNPVQVVSSDMPDDVAAQLYKEMLQG